MTTKISDAEPLSREERAYATLGVDMAGVDQERTALLIVRYEATVREKEKELRALASFCVDASRVSNNVLTKLINKAMEHLETTTKDTGCAHPGAGLYEGPRVPIAYGSAATRVCGLCKAWEMHQHSPGEWHTDKTVEEAAAEDDD